MKPNGFKSLRTRIVFFFLVLLVLVQGVTFLLVKAANHQIARQTIQQELLVGERLFKRLLEQSRRQLEQGATLLSSDFAFRQAIASDDTNTILSVLRNHGERIDANVMTLVSLEHVVLADTLQPKSRRQPFKFLDLLKRAAKDGKSSAIVNLNGRLYQMVVVPVLAPDPIAWMAMGFLMGDKTTQDLRQLTSMDVTFISREGAQPWRINASTLANDLQPQLLEQLPQDGKREQSTILLKLTEEDYEAQLTPLGQYMDMTVVALLQRSIGEGLKPFNRISSTILWLTLAGLVLTVLGSVAIARNITRPLNAAIHDANAIASGRLDSAIENVGRDEVAQLRRAMRDMQDNLARIVSSIRESSEAVATAAREIASSTQDMSARTESQAAGLEQTSASMEELNATFQKNDESSQHVSNLASQAADAAAKGGEVVGKVVRTMQEIDVSSKKIAEIIGVIDSIAFQTNILALNAAVEAARAGEQGRGFAVVATEVRALAQRSGQASKEIRLLINESVKKVQTGTREAADSGKAMDEILTAVRKVTLTMADMQNVRGDQRNGVTQVGRAIEQMNHGTQQSAAMVEQIAATTRLLSEQAEQLIRAVATFKLSGREDFSRHADDPREGEPSLDLDTERNPPGTMPALPDASARGLLASRRPQP